MADKSPEPVASEEQTQAAEAAEAMEAREDQALMELDGVDEDAPEEEAAEGSEVATDTEESAPDSKEEKTTSEGPSPELEEAMGVLRRDGFQQDDLSALSDEKILRLAEHRKKVQTDIDRMLSDKKADKDEAESQQESEEPNTAEAPSEQPTQDNLRQAAKLFGDHVGLDEESTELLAKSYEAMIAPMAQQVQAVNQQLALFQIEQARAGLVDQYPQVADTASDDWERVIGRMNKLQENGGYDTVAGLMEDAIAFEYRDQYKEQARSAKDTIRSYRANGSPSDAKGAPAKTGSRSSEQVEDDILNLLESDAPDRLERAKLLGRR